MNEATGGEITPQQWQQVQTQAGPYCPNTVARYPQPPRTRAQAEQMANQCAAESPWLVRSTVRERLNEAIGQFFPQRR